MKKKLNMRLWKEDVIRNPYKQGMPVLSFPCVSLMGITVKDLVDSSDLQAQGMKLIADRSPSLAAPSMMDLTVEAEGFGADVMITDDEVPSVIGSLVKTVEDANNLVVPNPREGRTMTYINAMNKACELITDRPVFAGIIGPFTLAGRLIGIQQTLRAVKKNPEMLHATLRKATDFIIAYAKAYKEMTGANGFVLAEPLTGLLGPKMAVDFSEGYTKEIIDAVQDEEFICIYHNCGDNAVYMADSIARLGAEGYHFGNVIKMKDILPLMPENSLVMGNIDPAQSFCMGDPAAMKKVTKELLEECCQYPNFVMSSGCDIAPIANWECIDAFYEAIDEFYTEKGIAFRPNAEIH